MPTSVCGVLLSSCGRLSIYYDRISSGRTSRPEQDCMVQNMRDGKIARVACYKLDRMGRSLTHLALIIDEMNRLQVPLICTSQGIDTSDNNPCGKFQLGVLMAVAEFEREIIRERVNSGLAVARAKGVRLGRPSTLNGGGRGFKIEGGRPWNSGNRERTQHASFQCGEINQGGKMTEETYPYSLFLFSLSLKNSRAIFLPSAICSLVIRLSIAAVPVFVASTP